MSVCLPNSLVSLPTDYLVLVIFIVFALRMELCTNTGSYRKGILSQKGVIILIKFSLFHHFSSRYRYQDEQFLLYNWFYNKMGHNYVCFPW